MPSKDEIIDNVRDYTAQELANNILAGVLTYQELEDGAGPDFAATKRKEVKELVEKGQGQQEETDWGKAESSGSIDELDSYLKNYPQGKHRDEARSLIDQLKTPPAPTPVTAGDTSQKYDDYLDHSLKAKIMGVLEDESLPKDVRMKKAEEIIRWRGPACKEELLALIGEDPNIFEASFVRKLCAEDSPIGMKPDDLKDAGIGGEFITIMQEGTVGEPFPPSNPLERINKTSTEVYFWGIPSSGKTCALGAIFSTAYRGKVTNSMVRDNNCQGYSYMKRLSELFKVEDGRHVFPLPEKTAVTATYEMGFDLVDEKDSSHPITCVDLAGEVMRCMTLKDADEPMSQEEANTLNTMTSILIANRTKNRKVHFFVLEYGAEKRKYKGLGQEEYLDGAMTYIKNNGIFEKETDAIFLLVTKADKIKCDPEQKKKKTEEYVENRYRGFFNNLVRICKKNQINDGNVEIIPFSLGTVCFQNYCKFDDKTAKEVVQKLLDHTKGFKGGRWGKFSGGLSR